jgi:uncharacterized protein YndB with AHSA1/START domain
MTPTTLRLPHHLDRRATIRAPRSIVFRYFTDSTRWAQWWGAGSTIDARPGGRVYIRYPNAVEASGEVVEVRPPERIVFTFGYASGTPVAPGASRVTISLGTRGQDTLLELKHEFADVAARDDHVQGWRYQLSVFANVVADETHADAQNVVDAWFSAWAEPDDSARRATLTRIASRDVQFRDRYAAIESLDDLVAHAGAAQRFMPGVRIERRGAVRHCQGMVLVDWAVTNKGAENGRGTSVFILSPTGMIERVTGFWGG